MKTIRQQQFERIERKENIIYAFTIAMTYLAISALGSLILMWHGGLL